MNNELIKSLYVDKKWTLRMIAKELGTDHHTVKRSLIKSGVQICNTDRKRAPLTEEHKNKIANKSRGREGFWQGKVRSKDTSYKNMVGHLKYDVELDWIKQFEDIEKLKYLNRSLSRRRDCDGFDTQFYKQFIEKFYYDDQFNSIYDKWKVDGCKDKYLKPSLDHIVPKAQDCNLVDLNNLQFLSWFENRCKNDLTVTDWQKIKSNITKYLI